MESNIALTSAARAEIDEFNPDVFEQVSFSDFKENFSGKIEGIDSKPNPSPPSHQKHIWYVKFCYTPQGGKARIHTQEDLYKGDDGKVYVLIPLKSLGLPPKRTKLAQVWLE